MKVPFRVALPAAMGLLCTPLMLWDIHNQQIIESMGMAWDTGAPIWPYQTPDILLFALNAPAALVANGLTNLSAHYINFDSMGQLRYSTVRYCFFFSAILLLWWVIGRYLDRSRQRQTVQSAPVRAGLLCVLALGLIAAAIEEFHGSLQWRWAYNRTLMSLDDLIVLRNIAPGLWCFALGVVALAAAWRRAHKRKPRPA